jgi:hypothetical protein
MQFFAWIQKGIRPSHPSSGRRSGPPAGRFRPRLEALEERWLPSTLTVTSLADDGSSGTLRSQIAAAKNNDTIVFDPSLVGQTIQLTQGELALNKNLDIEGPGYKSSPVYISANPTSRVFDILGGATVTLANNLWIENNENGRVAGQGGDIYNAGNLTLKGCLVSGGKVVGSPGSPGAGGGIYNAAGAILSINGGEIFSTSAFGYGDSSGGAGVGLGGAIYEAGGVVSIVYAQIGDDSNAPVGYGSSLGGGIYVAGGQLQVTHSQIGGGAVVYYDGLAAGGAIYQVDGNTSISDTTVSGFATGSIAQGGAIYQAGGTMNLANCSVYDSAATSFGQNLPQGGGIYLAGGTMNLTKCSFAQDTVLVFGPAQGGAIYQTGGVLDVANCWFGGNLSIGPVSQGGAIYLAGGSLVIQNSTFQDNETIGDGSSLGGAIYVAGGSLAIQNSTFQDNSALADSGQGIGGAIYIAGGSVCISQKTTFAGNFASTSDPDVYGPFTVC